MAYIALVVFIETPIFTKQIVKLLKDDEYAELQNWIKNKPESGNLIKGSGGLRKVRWAGSGRGKRGGIRVIYYWVSREGQIIMLLAYPKNEMDDLSKDEVKKLRHLVEEYLK
jgi:mRNA-degrading endonuclease RelE of RelBE toxin-antitoxin system